MVDLGIVDAVDRSGARCVQEGVSTGLFFSESTVDIAAAKAVCRGCPEAAACLRGALDRREPWGVWGGELFVQGVAVPYKRGRGRPRKTPLPLPA